MCGAFAAAAAAAAAELLERRSFARELSCAEFILIRRRPRAVKTKSRPPRIKVMTHEPAPLAEPEPAAEAEAEATIIIIKII